MALEPITRQEQIIAGKDLEPITRMEKFLKEYGGASSGIQIKKAVFTDRQSIYQWMLDNYQKVIYINVFCTQYPWWVKYTTSRYENDGTGNYGFGMVQFNCQNSTLVPSSIQLKSNEIVLMVDACIDVNPDNTVTGVYVEPVHIPDHYWSAMAIECNAYYFDE